MKIEIEVTEVPENRVYMFQSCFDLKEGNKIMAEYCETIPGSLPYIFIKEGVNKGKRFIIKAEELQNICELLIHMPL